MLEGKSRGGNSNASALQKLARWHPSANSSQADKKNAGQSIFDGPLESLEHDELKQGSLYILKINQVSVTLFEGWNDDLCCFSVLRMDATPMRWYLPGDFDAYNAFDEAGNPPVHLWTRYLRVEVPVNWFAIFEEARRKQREWTVELNRRANQTHYLHPTSKQSISQNDRSTQQQQQQQQQQNQQQAFDNSYGEYAIESGVPSSAAISASLLDPHFHQDRAYDVHSRHPYLASTISSLPTDAKPTGIMSSPLLSPGIYGQSDIDSFEYPSIAPHTLLANVESGTLGISENSLFPRESETGPPPPPKTTNTTTTSSSSSSSAPHQQQQQPSFQTIENKKSQSFYDAHLDFPHDSDQFSIHSEFPVPPSLHRGNSLHSISHAQQPLPPLPPVPQSNSSHSNDPLHPPTRLERSRSASIKSKRQSVKNMLWGSSKTT
ncbi:hypothetical protein PHYBLDRAFT_163730 [Phycomyces blakesleeanus NRRL 1555(-)]|uniref:Uncharacterized protein n=1 Tax=Phycomyces blakesleeanus (strain ATCC 8743b / DSM 1359 / FGSC 10004 / NBRC 33097 / NRRL 1555) TaxID=763407 RepID=A0A162UXK6_PHYB8|nr:hypothetical protein PHYBLDRAFT_163730 [Phycomyces blakesleeanus NRRL 1555(-)]OAD78633.1 hypothetical protein PHYBLDRAFT_163730 [Phycomyces blakesleeanus NRRL 1555(-)]|eukprot:XP_018296673.1 hypothetical protein PHYBLDRAFT_163730 [Phycomyces blakesleeanus NRRL 1555(-)]